MPGEAVPGTSVAVVTGAGRGIGRAIALGLAGRGVSVGLLGRDLARLEAVAQACAAHGSAAAVAVADVRDARAVRDAVAAVEGQLGPIDLLVNNAGAIDRAEAHLWEADPDDWWWVFDVNFRGSVNLCQAVLPAMVARRHGRIVNLNSMAAIRQDHRYTAYRAAKAALLALTGTLCGPLAEQGVTVLELSPGAVETDMTRGMAMFAGRTDWTSVDLVVDAIVRASRGELDGLSGMFLHVPVDDLTELAHHADDLRRTGARTLRLSPAGPSDPLAPLLGRRPSGVRR
ncbi:SDR family oxidoreductase [Micromonospora sp. ATCC 39149]|uniref:SDR family oxidoreductase n=1 Tax=Micromonospora carbonacea TaxID=47853 RepID=A0A7D6GKT5_9ACTN|nr:SDR family oxidoreductase [Micromonospora sp. ATCC 39149]QLK01228.1 SDR family oxidoreductase [Micromonospora carbonacea]